MIIKCNDCTSRHYSAHVVLDEVAAEGRQCALSLCSFNVNDNMDL